MTRTPGEHAPNIKNRSSKHLICLTKVKPVVRSWSNEKLYQLSWSSAVKKELDRRSRKAAKKAKQS